MNRKIRVAILFGGRSVEHDISLRSASNIIQNIDRERFEPVLIGIDKKGGWHVNVKPGDPLEGNDLALILKEGSEKFINLSTNETIKDIDIVFPVLHGTDGEDGSIQGMLKAANIPFVGCGVMSAAVSMDKEMTKKLLKEAGIPVCKYIVYNFYEKDKIDYNKVVSELGLPLIVKPASLGSSVGVSKVKSKEELEAAVNDTFQYDNKIVFEEFIKGRELECAIMGNQEPISSLPGEIVVNKNYDFYSFDAKYMDATAAELVMPAKTDVPTRDKIMDLCRKSYIALGCEDLSRVDLFLTEKGEVFINEINTLPGFTNSSMFPKLWELNGISYKELLTKLIEMALQKYEYASRVKTEYEY